MIPITQKRCPHGKGTAPNSKINNGRVVDESILSQLDVFTEQAATAILGTETDRLEWHSTLEDGRRLVVTAYIVPADDDHDLGVLLGRLGDVEHMQHRAVQDVVEQAQAATWERKSEALEWARPKPTDYNGLATEEQLRLRDRRLAEDAQACRQHAAVLSGRWAA